jgi:hypothetical protein
MAAKVLNLAHLIHLDFQVVASIFFPIFFRWQQITAQ